MPPLEFCLGTNPSQAEVCLPLAKLRASAIEATRALAPRGAMPGSWPLSGSLGYRDAMP